MNNCPEDALLTRYVSGGLEETLAESLSGHLETCEKCQRTVDDLAIAEDSLVAALRNGSSKSSTRFEPQLNDMIADARDLRSADTLELKMPEPPKVPEGVLGLEVFISCLRKSQLVPADEVEALAEELRPASGDEFARELIARKQITPFQARALLRGKWKGLVLGNYVVYERLGQGGMGNVFKARHKRLGRTVCIKVLRSTGRKSPEMLQRFRREAKTVAALDHPNFVVAHDADESNGIPYLVMEYIEGRDLARVVAEDGPVSVERAVTIVRQVAIALEYAHKQGMVHRDIKPHNLLLSADDDTADPTADTASMAADETGVGTTPPKKKRGPVVKILDMGLARFDSMLGESPDAMSHVSMTATGVVMGTVDYMSPEQALNSRYADARSDIYSLGCTLHFLITGRPLFEGETLMEKIVAHREQEAPHLSDIRSGIPAGLNAIFRRMVSKEPDERYDTMSELVADLDAFRDGRLPEDFETTPHRRANRRNLLFAIIAACALLIATGLGLWAAFGNRDDGDGAADNSNVSDQPTKAPPILGHPNTRFNGGPGRALVVLPFAWFYEDQYLAVKKSLSERGVEMVTASSQMGSARPKHGKIKPVPIQMTLDRFDVNDFDAIVFIEGNHYEFTHKNKNRAVWGATVHALHRMLKRRRAIVAVSRADFVLYDAGAANNCKFDRKDKYDRFEYAPVPYGESFIVKSCCGKRDQADRMIALVFDKLLPSSKPDDRERVTPPRSGG